MEVVIKEGQAGNTGGKAMAKEQDNPLKHTDEKLEKLEDFYNALLRIVEQKAQEGAISEENFLRLRRIIGEVYIEKKKEYLTQKANQFLENRLVIFDQYIMNSLQNIFKIETKTNNEKDFVKGFYLKHTKHLLTNEQY